MQSREITSHLPSYFLSSFVPTLSSVLSKQNDRRNAMKQKVNLIGMTSQDRIFDMINQFIKYLVTE
jgi:hypothetical protein